MRSYSNASLFLLGEFLHLFIFLLFTPTSQTQEVVVKSWISTEKWSLLSSAEFLVNAATCLITLFTVQFKKRMTDLNLLERSRNCHRGAWFFTTPPTPLIQGEIWARAALLYLFVYIMMPHSVVTFSDGSVNDWWSMQSEVTQLYSRHHIMLIGCRRI